MKKISVGEIIRYLYYLDYELGGKKPSRKALRDGIWYHQRLGFNQPEIFQKYFEYWSGKNKEWWLVRGAPDRIVDNDGVLYVDELKTVRKRPKSKALEVGSTQANIYAWLVGADVYRVFIFDVCSGELDKYEFEFDRKKLNRDLRKGIKIKKKLEKFRKSLKK